MNLSHLGVAHTLIGISALLLGIFLIISKGRIEWAGRLGKTYAVLTAIACFTALGIFKHGSFGPGHVLAVLTLLALAGAIGASRLSTSTRKYFEVILFTLSLLFSCIPTAVETLTRLPLASPLAHGPDDPIVQATLGGLALIFALVMGLQIFRLRAAK